ncbi:hypothetical protein H9L12_07855 [Sphingomonas rhizophila]|uniref:DUF4440 domain-containing protein n=1 Tax=Sphingomonas rhizophila TaxID=2071607 RepID=A0A7G9S8U6_9SPHN|nr:hypothetical protein [Sphingomonas rhizophila]QNN64271.1 hypothetical protein H9L12_07855 [Sphingomonas rhizophila]
MGQRRPQGAESSHRAQLPPGDGTKPCVILDGKSWFDAAPDRFTCSSYRFGDIYVRDVGSVTVFATQLDLKAAIDGHDWSGPMWVTALWKKSRVRRKWKLVERIYSRPEQSDEVAGLLPKLELWRR